MGGDATRKGRKRKKLPFSAILSSYFTFAVEQITVISSNKPHTHTHTHNIFSYFCLFLYSFFALPTQKNPTTIRTPEEDRGLENFTMTGWVNLDRSVPISRHLSICSEAKDSTYVRDVDLKSWAELPGTCSCSFMT